VDELGWRWRSPDCKRGTSRDVVSEYIERFSRLLRVRNSPRNASAAREIIPAAATPMIVAVDSFDELVLGEAVALDVADD